MTQSSEQDRWGELVYKYTGQSIPKAERTTEDHLLRLASRSVWQLDSVERELLQAADALAHLAAKVRSNVLAGRDDKVYQLDPAGELWHSHSAAKLDALLAQRAALVENVRVLLGERQNQRELRQGS